ncbi:hypothetical protein N9W00_02040, partial [Arcobacteraceae bacterium]|nr:hypothetical protein [Arcobacteraceae bacterium]
MLEIVSIILITLVAIIGIAMYINNKTLRVNFFEKMNEDWSFTTLDEPFTIDIAIRGSKALLLYKGREVVLQVFYDENNKGALTFIEKSNLLQLSITPTMRDKNSFIVTLLDNNLN